MISLKFGRIYHEFAFINHFQETGLVVLNTDRVKTRQGCRENRFGADRKDDSAWCIHRRREQVELSTGQHRCRRRDEADAKQVLK